MSFSDPRTGLGKFGALLAFSRELFKAATAKALGLIEARTLRALSRAEDTLLLSDTAEEPDVNSRHTFHLARGPALEDRHAHPLTPDERREILLAAKSVFSKLKNLHRDIAPHFDQVGFHRA